MSIVNVQMIVEDGYLSNRQFELSCDFYLFIKSLGKQENSRKTECFIYSVFAQTRICYRVIKISLLVDVFKYFFSSVQLYSLYYIPHPPPPLPLWNKLLCKNMENIIAQNVLRIQQDAIIYFFYKV